ncbi:heat repeat-containing protein 3 [Limosa lapponica baueri]|uniref:Heat repeat-containing protein 3 n=1 Tax=Limosa lapponica baueri TaxID=1758121 RepID=A0A2I0TDA7_LIMLA|nr:heat repeat-containing protein 3 [Limosa lapponica baueri]
MERTAGTIWNIKDTIPPGSLGSMVNAILKIFSESLAIDAGETIIRMNEAEKNRLKLAAESETEENMSDVIDNCVLSEDDMEEIPKGKVRRENDISDLLPIRKEGKGQYSTDQLCVLDNVKMNLRRFIAYQETLGKTPT